MISFGNLHDLSRRTGLSVAHLSRIQSGKRGLSMATLNCLASALGVTMNELLHQLPARVKRRRKDEQK
jgi:transcriptional regulator with XRE-family HTH domain